jgi:hypothetical protein
MIGTAHRCARHTTRTGSVHKRGHSGTLRPYSAQYFYLFEPEGSCCHVGKGLPPSPCPLSEEA